MFLIWHLKFVELHNISKAFDKVLHNRLIFKLLQNSICNEMINILENFLSNRKQRVVLNGQCLSWVDIHPDIPKGSNLGSLLFLTFIDALKVNANYLLMTHLCLLWFVTSIIQQRILTGPRNNIQQEKHCFYPPSYLF